VADVGLGTVEHFDAGKRIEGVYRVAVRAHLLYHRIDLIAVAQGVVEAFEEDGGSSFADGDALTIRCQYGTGIARQVHGPDNGLVDVALPQGPHGDGQGAQAGAFLT
jgi:hypothetical protein